MRSGIHPVKVYISGAGFDPRREYPPNALKYPLRMRGIQGGPIESHPESVPSDNASIGPPWIPLILKGYFKAFGIQGGPIDALSDGTDSGWDVA
jgi:hypothetical protein